jgi:Pro-kumamolisin, activation domain/Bacterial Ig-like domain (group 3)
MRAITALSAEAHQPVSGASSARFLPSSRRWPGRLALSNSIVIAFVLLGASLRVEAQGIPAQARITAPVDEAVMARRNTHPLARPEFDQGAAPPDLPMDRMLLVLKRSSEQESALQSLLDQQHDKSSANYHRWLTPDEFGRQFGPADQDIQAVTSWLQSRGFQVARVGRGRTAIEFSGTAAQVRDAFRTAIHSYLAEGAQHWANATDPQIPAALAPVVSGVAALHNFPMEPLHHVAGSFSKSAATGEVKPTNAPSFLAGGYSTTVHSQFTFGGCQPACYALSPDDFATIYDVLPLWNANPAIDGSGQSIAIVGRSNINVSDVQDFRRLFGLPANDPAILIDGPDPFSIPGDETESLLDVEWSGAVAPGAKIKLVTSASTNTESGIVLSALYAVDNDVAPILSVSYGQCELFLGTAGNQFFNLLWEQAAAEGITVIVATGDSGSAVCDRFRGLAPQSAKLGLAVNGLASTPFNVAVGGTDFLNFGPNFSISSPSPYWTATNGVNLTSAKGYIPESTWNNSCTTQGLGFIGFESGAEPRCNDSQLNGLVVTVGGSGGRSNCVTSDGVNQPTCTGGYPSPPWQTTGLNDTVRDVPDVSLFASDGLLWNSFYIVCEADVTPGASCRPGIGTPVSFIGVGGTSAAAPAFAGMMALVNAFTNSSGQGNANYVLYKLPSLPAQQGLNCDAKSTPNSACIFNDVTFGTIAMPCAAGSTPDCTVSLGGDKYGVLSGYDAGAGYDRATGLGSVNATNLVRSWSQVTFNSTSTTLTLDGRSGGTVSGSIPHGTPVPVTVTVTKNASGVPGTPTGDVSLVASSVNGEGVDGRTLSSGIATWQTNQLPGGSYSVHAHYAGDGTFGASDSGAIGVTVTPETSAIILSALTFAAGQLAPVPPSVPYGTTVYLRADVGSATKATGSVPTGNVTFTDNTSASQTYSLNSEGAAIAGNGLCTLTPGAHSFTASYSGDNSYQPSGPTSPTSFTINPATPQVAVPQKISVSVNTASFGFSVFVGETIGINPLTRTFCAPALPTGTITLFDATTQKQIATSPIPNGASTQPGQSVAQITVFTSALSFGNNSVTAVYSGDSNYQTSTSSAITIQVGFGTSTMLTSSNPTVPVSTNVTFTAQVTSSQSGAPPITGNMTFQVDVSAGTTVPLVNGTAQFTTSFASPAPSSHQISARYSGDQNYIPSGAFLREQIVIPDFTLSDSLGNAANIIIPAAGQSSAAVTLTVTGTNGYNGTIAFSPASCVITPAGSLSSCNFSPSSVTGSGSTQLVINTTGPRAAGTLTGHFVLHGTKLQPIAVCLLFLVTLTLFNKQRRFSLVFGSVILLALFGLWACGGGSSSGATTSANTIPGTPTGVPYTATINAAPSGENGHTISLTFTVQ